VPCVGSVTWEGQRSTHHFITCLVHRAIFHVLCHMVTDCFTQSVLFSKGRRPNFIIRYKEKRRTRSTIRCTSKTQKGRAYIPPIQQQPESIILELDSYDTALSPPSVQVFDGQLKHAVRRAVFLLKNK
jgi:hypothetical protein